MRSGVLGVKRPGWRGKEGHTEEGSRAGERGEAVERKARPVQGRPSPAIEVQPQGELIIGTIHIASTPCSHIHRNTGGDATIPTFSLEKNPLGCGD
jgi:hypothetical protein